MYDKEWDMSENVKAVTEVAAIVMRELEPLSSEDKQRVLSSISALFSLSLPSLAAQGTTQGGGSGFHNGESTQENISKKKISLVELLKEKSPVTNPQRIAVFAYYKEQYEGLEKFSKADILPMFAVAKLAKPANFDRDFSRAVSEGWIHEEGSESYLTSSGEGVVNDGFGGKAKARGRGASKSKKSKTKGNVND